MGAFAAFYLWFSERGSREKGRKVDKNSHSRSEMTEEGAEAAAAGSSFSCKGSLCELLVASLRSTPEWSDPAHFSTLLSLT